MSKTRDILSSPRVEELKRTKRKTRKWVAVLCVFLFICIVVGLSFLSNYNKMTINSVVVSGTKTINDSDVQDFINQKLSGKYIYLFNRHNAFIYPHSAIYDGLLEKFPRIEKLSVGVKNVTTLSVTIRERSGSYMWCGSEMPADELDKGDNCYFVNDDGYIFDRAPYVSGDLYFKYYLPLSDKNKILGTQMLQSSDFYNTVRFIDAVRDSGLFPVSLVFEKDGTKSLYLKHKDGESNPRIIFNSNANMDKVGRDIGLSMAQKDFKNEIESKYATLQYIDMRFNNKVFYKFQ